MICRRLLVKGRVQGVFYRDWTVRTAQTLGLSGWVRNRSDGSVEILAAGEEEALAALISACHEGPPRAAVETVEVSEAPPPDTKGFERRTSE